jgi:hypothetical protein
LFIVIFLIFFFIYTAIFSHVLFWYTFVVICKSI